jgi:transmembrane sensor
VTAHDEAPFDLDPLVREALAWVIHLHSGAATSEDAERLRVWRAEGADHEEAFRTAVRLWRSFGEGARALASPAEGADVQNRRRPSPRLSRRALFGVGASAVAAAVAADFFVVEPPSEIWTSIRALSADYRTSKGERREVTLSKGLSLTLDTETSIQVSRKKDASQIELLSGQAVIRANRVPIVLLAANGRISASQAEFDARCLDGVVSVSCLDGTIDVTFGDRTVPLPRDHKILYSSSTGLDIPQTTDPADVTAWQKGLLIARHQSIFSVVKELNRYRYGRILIVNSGLGKRMITGTFHLDRPEDFIDQVRSLFGASASFLPGGIVLLG